MKTKYKTALIILLLSICGLSCKKDWLEAKRDISVIVPTTLKDLRLLMNSSFPLNYDTRGITEVSSDDITVTQSMYDAITIQYERNALLWKSDIWEGATEIAEWDTAYEQVQYANVVLDALKNIERNNANAAEYDDIKGNALYVRSRAFLNLVMTFAKAYNLSTAGSDLGIPLKLTPDIYEPITRASVKSVYEKIATDLTAAGKLLKATAIKTLPSKAAGYGLLARTYLYMQDYDKAETAADSSLKYNSSLVNFNTLSTTATWPIPTLSAEMHIYSNITRGYFTQLDGYATIDQQLYASYESNDLRKDIFFRQVTGGSIGFKGSYIGTGTMNGATTTGEMLLTRAECRARRNNITGALTDLNSLLVVRYRTGTFINRVATDNEQALSIILTERRKELLRRGLRWQDLKRLNLDPAHQKTLTKTVGGITYTLLPNDLRYIMPIPEYTIEYNGIQQNIR